MAQTDATRDAIAMMIEDYIDSGLMSKDFLELEPKDRMNVVDKLLRYRLPQLSSVDVNATVTAKTELDEELRQLADL
jgi:hypothetical protein